MQEQNERADREYKPTARMEASNLETLRDHPGYILLCQYIRSQMALERSNLESCDPNNAGLIGKLQGKVDAYKSVLSRVTTRIKSIKDESK